MARKPVVSRTITTTKVTVLCLDVEQKQPFEQTVTLPRTYRNDAQILKIVRDMLETETVKVAHIAGSVVENKLYGMPESKFIELADEMPPRTSPETAEIETENEGE